MTISHLEAFESWLLQGEYRPRTVANYVGRLAGIAKAVAQGAPLHHDRNYQYAARLYLTFLDRADLHEDQALVRALRELSIGPTEEREQLGLGGPSRVQARRAKQKRARRRREARSFSDSDWRKLYEQLREETGHPAGAVLYVLASTALRVGDLLLLSRKALREGYARGYIAVDTKGGEQRVLPVSGAPDAWAALLDVWEGRPGSTVLNLLSPNAAPELYSGHPAYTQLDRLIKSLAKELGLEGRAHLHRIRRTLAVQALRTTGDVGAVQQMLGHDSIRSTYSYVDEARPDDVADIQRRVRERFTDDDDSTADGREGRE